MSLRRFILLLLLAAFLCACDADQEDPYKDYSTPAIEWPSLDPNRYHWDGQQNPFYEGWFFRLTLPEAGRSFAFIYAVQNPGAQTDDPRGAYVVAFGDDGLMLQDTFALDEFHADIQELDVKVGDNRATFGRLVGSCGEGDESAAWDLRITVDESWSQTMGLLTNIPYLPINWYVGALRAKASGTIVWRGETFAVEGAPFFQDHNWGDYFPEAYVWINAMDFADKGDVLAFSGGIVETSELGMFVWRRGDKLYEARSQDLTARMTIDADADAGEVRVNIVQGDDRFLLTGYWLDSTPVLIPAPSEDGYVPYTHMALTGRVRVQRFTKSGWTWEMQEEQWSELAGVEIGGAFAQ